MQPDVGTVYRVCGWWTGDFVGKCVNKGAVCAGFQVERVISGDVRAGEIVDVNFYHRSVHIGLLGEGAGDAGC